MSCNLQFTCVSVRQQRRLEEARFLPCQGAANKQVSVRSVHHLAVDAKVPFQEWVHVQSHTVQNERKVHQATKMPQVFVLFETGQCPFFLLEKPAHDLESPNGGLGLVAAFFLCAQHCYNRSQSCAIDHRHTPVKCVGSGSRKG